MELEKLQVSIPEGATTSPTSSFALSQNSGQQPVPPTGAADPRPERNVRKGVGKAKGKPQAGKGKGVCSPPLVLDKAEFERKKALLREKEREAAIEKEALRQAGMAKREELRQKLPQLRSAYMDLASPPRRSSSATPDGSEHFWAKAVGSLHLEGGGGTVQRGGVTIIEFDDGSAVCLRRTPALVSELVASSVATHLGIPIAQTRLVAPGSWEHKEIIKAETSCDFGETGGLVMAASHNPHVMIGVVDFVPGVRLDAAKQHFDEGPPSTQFFKQLGELQALDMLINNMDRLPLPLWRNPRGNFGNMMVPTESSGGKHVVGIDQQVFVIQDERGMQSYLAGVEQLVQQLFAGDVVSEEDESSKFRPRALQQSLKDCFQLRLGVSLDEASTTAALKGLREQILNIAGCYTSGSLRATTSAASDGVRHQVSKSNPHLLQSALKEAQSCTDFVLAVADAIAKAIPQ